MMFAVVLQTPQVVVQDVPVTPRHTVIGNHFLQGSDHIIEFRILVPVGIEVALQLAKFFLGPRDSILVVSAKCGGLYMVQVFANFGEQMRSPPIPLKPLVAMGIPIGRLRQKSATQDYHRRSCSHISKSVQHMYTRIQPPCGSNGVPAAFRGSEPDNEPEPVGL